MKRMTGMAKAGSITGSPIQETGMSIRAMAWVLAAEVAACAGWMAMVAAVA